MPVLLSRSNFLLDISHLIEHVLVKARFLR